MELINTCFVGGNHLHSLAYYSHILPITLSLIIGYIVVRYAQNRDKAMMFFGFTVTLSLWLVGNLVTWTANNYNLVAAFWAPLDFLNVLFFIFLFLFAFFDFTQNQRLRVWAVILGLISSLPPLLITVAGVAVHEFDEPNCEMIGNDWLALYKFGLEISIVTIIIIVGTISIARHWQEKREVRRILLTKLSTVGFLVIFAGSEFLSTYTENYEINLYALFTLPIFILLLAVSIFEMHTFRLKLESIKIMQVLFVVFVLITISNLYVSDDLSELIISSTGVIITLGFGLLFYRGANREAEQRKQIEHLADKLEKANHRLKELDKQKSEFVSIASHQLRSPITSIRGYASLLLENSFGDLPEKAIEPLRRIEQSSKLMALAIEDYLNVSRIESGNMKYNKADFNLRDEVTKVCDDMRGEAVKKGLVLIFRSDLNSRGVVNADIGKVIQIVQNLITNSIKYTQQGSIKVLVRDDIKRKKIYFEITDTGIGLSTEAQKNLFQKFERAANANSVNINGTGLGLYVALKMAEAMGGNVTVYSEGDGKGSRFTLELPLAM